MEKGSLAQKIYSCPFSSHVLWLKRQTYILGAVENFGSNFDRMKIYENEGQNEKQKESCSVSTQRLCKNTHMVFWWIWGTEMLYGNLTYILGADTCRESLSNF